MPPIPQPLERQTQPKSNGLTVALFILIFFLVASTGYLGYQNIQLQSQIAALNITPTIEPTTYISPIPTAPVIDLTANWKTINRKNWQFKVPTSWNYLECSNDSIFVGAKIDNDQTIECAFDGSPGTISVQRTSGNYKATIQTNTNPNIDPVVSDKKSITVGGRPAIWQHETVSNGQGVGDRIVVYVVTPLYTDVIVLHAMQEVATFTQILSTFRFLDASRDTTEAKNACIAMQSTEKYWDEIHLECREGRATKEDFQTYCKKYNGKFVDNADTCRYAQELGQPCGPEATYYCSFR